MLGFTLWPAELFTKRPGFPLFSITSLIVFPPVNFAKIFYICIYAIAMSIIMGRKRRAANLEAPLSRSEKQTSKVQIEIETDAPCAICHEPVGHLKPEGFRERWSVLPCGHQFGSVCIKQYLRIVADNRPSCPTCRQIAYHACGHPAVPAFIPLDGSKPGKPKIMVVEVPQIQVHESGIGLRTIQRGRISKWKVAFGWLRTLASGPRRILKRNRPQEVRQNGQDRVSTIFVRPWGDSTTTSPYIDPFPRPRDPEWEEWWDSQLPRL
jgi:hypothetical protein